MKNNRFEGYEDEVRQLVQEYELMQRSGGSHYYDVEELTIIIDYYLDTCERDNLEDAVRYAENLFPQELEIRLRRAHVYCAEGRYEAALNILNDLLQLEPDNTDVHYALGAVYSALDHPQKSIHHYQKAATDGYRLDLIYGNIGDEYLKLEDWEHAKECYKKSLGNNPDEDRSLLNLYYCWEHQSKLETAASFFKHHVENHPYCHIAWYCLGCAYYWLGLTEQSLDAFEFTITIHKEYYNAYLGLSSCLQQLGKTGEAVSRLLEGINYSNDRASTFIAIATIYMDVRNYNTAIVYLKQAVGEDRFNDASWGLMADCYDMLNDPDNAEPLYQRALGMNGEEESHWLGYADFLLHHERFKEAADLLKEGERTSISPYEFNSRLAFCYYKMGKHPQLYEVLNACAADYTEGLNTILIDYPDMKNDPEVVRMIAELRNSEQ